MKYLNGLKASCVVILFTFNVATAAEGVKIQSTTKDVSSGSTSSTNIYLTSDKVLLENRGGRDNGSVVFDAIREEFRFIDHNKKEYYVFDKQTLIQLKDQIKMMAMMMRQFADQMSEEQRKKLDKIMNPNSNASMEFKASNKTQKVSRWKTTKYEGYTDGAKITEMYIATFESIGIDKERFTAMQKMMSFFKQNLNEITALLPTGGSFSQIGFDESSPVFKDGIPVKTISYNNGTPKDENIVNSISSENIAETLFNIPQGYIQRSINIQNQMGR